MSDLRDANAEFRHSRADRIAAYFFGYLMACFGISIFWALLYKVEFSIYLNIALFFIASALLIPGLLWPPLMSSRIILRNNIIQQRFWGVLWVNFYLDEDVQINNHKIQNEFAKDSEYVTIRKGRSVIYVEDSIVGYHELYGYVVHQITSSIRTSVAKIWPDSVECDVFTQAKLRSGCPISAISPASEIYAQLGIYGMDLRAIIEDLREKYGTNFDDFSVEDYGPPDTAILVKVRRKLGWRGNYKSLTVGRLVDAVRRGAWSEGARPT